MDPPRPLDSDSEQAAVAAPFALLALRHTYGYEPTAEALAHQLCALMRLQWTQHGSDGQGPSAALSVAEARRFVEHICLIHGAAHGQPGRVLARFHPTVKACALKLTPDPGPHHDPHPETRAGARELSPTPNPNPNPNPDPGDGLRPHLPQAARGGDRGGCRRCHVAAAAEDGAVGDGGRRLRQHGSSGSGGGGASIGGGAGGCRQQGGPLREQQ